MDRIIHQTHDLKVRTGEMKTKGWDRRKIEIDPQELRVSFKENDGDIKAMAKEFGVSDNTIRTRLIEFEIVESKSKTQAKEEPNKTRQQNGRSTILTVMFKMNQAFTKKFMERALVNNGHDVAKASAWIGGSEQQFKYYMKRLAITYSNPRKRESKSDRLDNIEKLLRQVLKAQK